MHCVHYSLVTVRDVLKMCLRIFQGDVLLISILRLADRPRSVSESALRTDAGSQSYVILRAPGRSNYLGVQVHASAPNLHTVVSKNKNTSICWVYVRVRMRVRLFLLR